MDRGTCLYALGRKADSRLRSYLNQPDLLVRSVDELQPRESPRKGTSSPVMRRAAWCVSESSYLVDPASSHMLVSKIKPCMSKYKQICTVKLRMAH